MSLESAHQPSQETKPTALGGDIAILQEEIAAWADSVIPDRDSYSTIAKLLSEIGELVASERMSDPEELADVAILVLDLFHLQKVDMAEAVRNKMQVNIRRRWKVSDNGSAQHI